MKIIFSIHVVPESIYQGSSGCARNSSRSGQSLILHSIRSFTSHFRQLPVAGGRLSQLSILYAQILSTPVH